MEEKRIGDGEDPGEFLNDMYIEAEDTGETITTNINGIRVIMFPEKKHQVPDYDGPT